MPENILVVEYEPRYTDRVKQALAGQPFEAWFAKDGEEALRVIDTKEPRLIVLSSVVPKVSTSDLIRAIRGRDSLQRTPILLTVSGYRGESPRADAVRLGASDILPKPYSEVEFLGKVQQMLGVARAAWSPVLDGDFTVRMANVPAPSNGQLTSNEIFGELLDDDKSPSNAARKPMSQKDDVDKMLADTLAGMMPKRRDTKETPAPAPAPSPAAAAPAPPTAPPKPRPSSPALDKRFQDTLSGLEKNARRVTSPGNVPTPTVVTPIPTPPPAAPRPTPPPPVAHDANETVRMAIPKLERMPISQPVFPAAVPASHPEDEEPTDGTKFGQYVLLEKIATGGMAEVWKARMRGVEGFQKIVAIKKILPHLSDNQDFIEMFVDEAKLAAQLNHNNIIHIYDLGKIQSSYYIAMEYIDGYDLKNILKKAQERDQPLSVEIALFVASKIAAALDYAHRKRDFEDKEMGLVHRDVSPQNVLISEEGDIKLCDFGIAKAASKASHTQAGALKGKLQYMSPEQAWGRNIDRRSDIFALATVLFEMLTARKLFAGDNELSILEQVREARVTPPSTYNDEVTPQIDAIVLKALQKDPANRYQTAGEMQRDLDAVLYNFKPTPTSADLAIYMHRLASSVATPSHTVEMHASEPPQAANELKPLKPAPVVAAPAIPTSMPAVMPAAAAATPSKPPVVPIAIVAVLVIGAAIAYFAMRKPKSATPVVAKPAVVQTQTTTSIAATSTAPVLGTTATTSTAPAIDPSKVNEEVAKRMAAEKARLAELARTQNQQTTTARPAAAPPPQQVATQTVAPPPVVENRPAPAPQPPPAPVPQPVAENRPAPQPEAPRTQVGDLVPSGTPGLTPAHMTHQAAANYPPIARVQHVQGSVIVSVLVSETGQVLETRVVSGPQAVLNEAAQQSIRRSTFAPGEKDGVRVKSWTNVRVDFKL
ncbi:MAG: eukaryotic-like serine/threonine-protein kinase [Thermoanaerobaculia bacterium]|jgi:TonB family protein|nr:eukaryotic-like serine/threonine-protein kinase [Thermoanaerobaculia bacterium]